MVCADCRAKRERSALTCGIISVTGADAVSFLHNQLTNSVEGLQAGDLRLAGYCSVKGRLLADFLVWRDHWAGVEGAEAVPRILLLVNRELLAPLQKRLSMYVLRAKAKLADASAEFAVLGLVDTSQTLPQKLPDNSRRMALAAGLQHIIGTASELPEVRAALLTTHQEAPAAAWEAHRIARGVPHLQLATQDKFVPQMVNFELLGGIDFKKGCFPGQEVVARSQYLGKMKRRSFLGSVGDDRDGGTDGGTDCGTDGSTVAALAGAPLFAVGGEEIGNVVNAVAAIGGGLAVLAELPTDAATEGAVALGRPDGPLLSFYALPYDIPVPAPMVRPKL